ncbi:MAG: helix-turn-helix domain-containing protein [Hyphomicrobium sp.]
MTGVSERKSSSDDGGSIATLVREALARRRMSRQRLADEARISISTLEKALSGRRPFTLATLVRIEEALGVALRPAAARSDKSPTTANGVAPDHLGNYARAAVQWIEGDYLTLRPSFGEKSAVYAYRTEIYWDAAASTLAFRESERIDRDFTQFGAVSVPHQSGHIYLVTNRHGQYRLVIVARPTITGEMHGILTTLQVGRGAQLTPVAAPIVLVPMEADTPLAFGRIAAGHTAFAKYRALLRRTLDDSFASLVY